MAGRNYTLCHFGRNWILDMVIDKFYCLGSGHDKRCDECQWLKNWNELNEFEYDERHEIQDDMTRIDSMKCCLTKMGAFKNKNELLNVNKENS